jgi:hypothetical protein
LEDAERIGERKAKAITEQTGLSRSVVQEFGHRMVRVEDKTRRSGGRGADASNDEWAGESG